MIDVKMGYRPIDFRHAHTVEAKCGKTPVDRVGYYWVDPSNLKRKTQDDDVIACGDDAFLAGVSMI